MAGDLSRRSVMTSAAAGLLAATAARAQPTPLSPPPFGVTRLDPALDALIDAGSPIETIMTSTQLSEGPVWVGGADGYLLVSDVPGNVMRRWSRSDGDTEFLRPSGHPNPPPGQFREAGSNGLILARGGLVMADCGNRGIGFVDLRTRQKTMLCTHFEGRRFNSPNDLVLAPDGSIYFNDPPFGLNGGAASPLAEMGFTAIYRLAPDNSVSLVERVQNPNGIGLSPDGRILYTTEQGRGWVAFDLDAQGRASNKRAFVDSQTTGILGGDGLKVDSTGHVWATGREGISIFTPDGRRLGIINAPGANHSNCAFGADGYLYITGGGRVARVAVKARKIDLDIG